MNESQMVSFPEQSTRRDASGQITSNFQFREIDAAMRIMVKMVNMVETVTMIVMVVLVAMVIMVTKVIIIRWSWVET